jgi:hypothetical protein
MRRRQVRDSVLLGAALLVAACGEADDEPAGAPPPPGATASTSASSTTTDDGRTVIHETPVGEPGDPFVHLPDTDSNDRLLVSTSGEDVALEVIDLHRDVVVPIPDIEAEVLVESAFLPDGSVAYIAGPRTVGFVSGQTGEQPEIAELPGDVAGRLLYLFLVDDAIVATVRLQDTPRVDRSVILELDGALRCVMPAVETNVGFPSFAAGWMWSPDLATRFDLATCSASVGLDLGGAHGSFFVTSGSDGIVVADDDLVRFDLDTGERRAARAAPDGDIWALALMDTGLWVIAGEELLRVDPTSLETTASTPYPCLYDPEFVELQGDPYVLEDCGYLYRIDATSGRLAEAWQLPHDDASDTETTGFPTPDGAWIVDVEQSGEPYFFDVAEGRFERLPNDLRRIRRIFALDFDVDPAS